MPLIDGELIPFMGEEMTCLFCGKVEMSDPAIEGDWRAAEANGKLVYACPDHFPAAGASKDEFGKAYYIFIQAVLDLAFADLEKQNGRKG